jgi:hypothetical protein
MVTTIVTSTTQSISVGSVRPYHNSGHLVFLTKDRPMMWPYSKRLVLHSWNTLNGISQRCKAKGELNFLDYFDNRRFSMESDVVKYDKL